jgi:uncharacterized protein YndB with AHSA1/START domain
MAQTETIIAPLELILNRTFNAPRERIFRAWTEAAELDRWFGPFADAKVKSSVDLRVGGAYSIAIQRPGGPVFTASGVYREIRRPERLVFTWNADGGPERAEGTLVTIEFFEDGDKTHVTLTHQKFTSSEMRERHEHGWRGCFDRLESLLASRN